MLHIHNGDSSANTAKESDMPGEHVGFREALIAGPTPGNASAEEWKKIRARHLAEAYGLTEQGCETDLTKQEEMLAGSMAHDEVVLWFEHDLFCQVNLIYLLDWFSHRTPADTKLSLVCIGEFPGIESFRGLGQLGPAELSSLFPQRRELSDRQFSIAAQAWKAYCSPTPEPVQALRNVDTSPLPYLENALLHHLARFPSVRNGLGRIEKRALELIDGGYTDFPALFNRFGQLEPVYGLGDAQFWNELKRIIDTHPPLLTIDGPPDFRNESHASNDFIKYSFRLTDEGRAALSGQRDYAGNHGIEYWLGGVHLNNKDLWRWDEDHRVITK
jgi:hypothetical protein